MPGLRPLSFFIAVAFIRDYFMIPLGGCFIFRSKSKRLRRRFFCSPNSLKQASLVRKTKNPRKFVGFEVVWRRERDCPRFARTSGDSTSKNKCRGFAPYHFSLLSLWKVNFPRSINEKCPIKGHLFFVRRERDSNPRTCDSQRFSRPPNSTALPSLRRESKTSKPNYKEIIEKTS